MKVGEVVKRKEEPKPEMIFSKQMTKDKDGKLIQRFYINNKEVSEHAYLQLSDDILYKSDITNIQPEQTEECNCPDCQALRETIRNIRQMDDKEALEYLRSFMDTNLRIAELNTQIDSYNEFGKQFFKSASILENQLEQQFGYTEEYYEDDNDEE
jgi:transcription elongation factor Elf1